MTEQELIDQMNKNDHAFQQQGGGVPSEEEKLIQQMHQNDPGLGQYDPKKYGILYNQTGQGMAALNNLGAVPTTMPTPKPAASWWDLPGNIAPSAVNLGKGIAHAVRHPLDTFAELSGMAGGEVSLIGQAAFDALPPESQDAIRKGGLKAVGALTPQMQQMVIEHSPKLMQMIADEGNKVNSLYKDRYGGWDNIRNTIITDPVGFWADAGAIAAPAVGMPGRLGALAELANPVATAGKAAGWLAERTGVADLARTVGGRVADTVIPSLADRRLWPSIEQAAQNDLLNRSTEGNVEGVRNALEDSRQPTGTMDGYPMTEGQFVPGSKPTSGQVIAGSDSISPAPPRSFAAMQMDANNNFGTVKDVRALDQNQAQLNFLKPIGRDPVENTAAFGSPVATDALHNSLARREYGAANRVVSKADDDLLSFRDKPLTGEAYPEAMKTAGEVPEDFWIGTNSPAVAAHSVPSSILDAHGNPTMINVAAKPAKYADITGKNLQRWKEEMDALIYGRGDGSPPKVTPSQGKEALNTRNELVDWINNANPLWQKARENYGVRSNILDRMMMGDELRKTLMNPLMGEDSGTLNATAFGNALKEAPNRTNSIVSKTKGTNRGDSLDDFLKPGEMDRVNRVGDDLGRSKKMEQQAKSGKAFSNALNTAGSDFIGGRWLGKIPMGDAVTDFLMGRTDKRVADRVGTAMFDPAEMEELLSQTLGRQEELSGLKDWLGRRYKGSLGSLNKYPGIYNALGADQDK